MSTARLPLPEAPCEFFCFDVETTNPPEEEVVKDFEANYDGPPKGWKDLAKIEEHRSETLLKWHEKAALLDIAPIAMVGMLFEEETFLLHGLKAEKAKWFGKNGAKNRVSIEGFASEKELMQMVCRLLTKKVGPETRGVTHNGFGFDLGKVRLAIVRNGLPLPEIFRVMHLDDEERQPWVDTMRMYCRYFARAGQLFIKQETMLENLGIEPLLKNVATGADVPVLLKNGKINEVAAKLLADLVGLRSAFTKMTGR
jgi:hypothetical protein